VEEAQRHRVAGQHAVRASVVEGQHGPGSITRNDLRDARVNQLECVVPGDPLEPARALRADTPLREAHAVRPVDELGVGLRHLGANRPVREGIGPRPAHSNHALVGDAHREAARIRTIERTDTGLLYDHPVESTAGGSGLHVIRHQLAGPLVRSFRWPLSGRFLPL
jgi:hypothetical protein